MQQNYREGYTYKKGIDVWLCFIDKGEDIMDEGGWGSGIGYWVLGIGMTYNIGYWLCNIYYLFLNRKYPIFNLL